MVVPLASLHDAVALWWRPTTFSRPHLPSPTSPLQSLTVFLQANTYGMPPEVQVSRPVLTGTTNNNYAAPYAGAP